ncbi:hypothetical protein FB384_000781 [Prauserella sediminis]|uniref:Small secreted protein n=1 Tax=Prauserella sediminis TaxID=577680 RepID=A0A839XHB8_9PSEU|nr:hypothetical protein [Prauserella sediminis]MBB3661877.1 hypothetical protein [Prauserella sediminis]
MRIRTLLVAVAGVLVVLASACSREAGPMPSGGGGEDPGPAALATKVRALTEDVCYRSPADIEPTACEKYVTQLGSIAGSARDVARGEHGREDHAGLTEAAKTLDEALSTYNSAQCGRSAGGSTDDEACTQTLQDIASALGDVQSEMQSLPEVSGQGG